MSEQTHEIARKVPKQARSRRTIDTILEATAQILADDGGEQLTTNHLAEHAGYSVGTLYQYFENREAIVIALIERQRDEVQGQVDALLETRRDDRWEDKVGAIVQLLHDAFSRHRDVHPRLVRALIAFSLDHGLPEPSEHFSRAIIQVWREAGKTQGRVLNEAEAFVLNRAVIEVLRAATLQSSMLLGTQDLEDAIVRLVMGFLHQPGANRADAGA